MQDHLRLEPTPLGPRDSLRVDNQEAEKESFWKLTLITTPEFQGLFFCRGNPSPSLPPSSTMSRQVSTASNMDGSRYAAKMEMWNHRYHHYQRQYSIGHIPTLTGQCLSLEASCFSLDSDQSLSSHDEYLPFHHVEEEAISTAAELRPNLVPNDIMKRGTAFGISSRRRADDSVSASSGGTTGRSIDRDDCHWLQKYGDLVSYFQKHGHSNVPSIYGENPALGFWVKRTRHQYKLYLEGKTTSLNEARIDLLHQVQFQHSRRDNQWESRYEKLADYKRRNGHIKITHREDPVLFNWLKRQRQVCYQYRRTGTESNMLDERYHKLRTLGI